jgi:SsrA-binding protein
MPNGTVATNRRARHDYFIEDSLEAGLELLGSEVKSLREHQVSIQESYAAVEGGEVWLYNMHIAPYKPAAHESHDPYRKRRLLLHKTQIRRLERSVQQKGYTLIPLKIYFARRGHAKVELGLCKGKRKHDKREAIKERDFQRRAERDLREHQEEH